MIVVSDTSPITTLLQVGRCELLRELFGDVLIPPAVAAELLRFHSVLPTFMRIQLLAESTLADNLATDLDRGEAEAIALACEVHADFLLVDEKRGRLAATQHGVKVIGLLGVLLRGKLTGRVESLRSLIAELENSAGFFVSDAVREAILHAGGEA